MNLISEKRSEEKVGSSEEEKSDASKKPDLNRFDRYGKTEKKKENSDAMETGPQLSVQVQKTWVFLTIS